MAQQTSVSSLLDMTSSSNVVFLGEAGSGKSEIALNFAQDWRNWRQARPLL